MAVSYVRSKGIHILTIQLEALNMYAIAADEPFKLSEGNKFYKKDFEKPELNDKDVFVKVKSIGMNPVDTKTRQTEIKQPPRILGYDAVGVVEDVGSEVTSYKKGDVVFYSGRADINGSNATHQVMHEAYIAHAPKNVSLNEAAGFPLTSLTASETLFEVFNISKNKEDNKGKSILIINGAGGVGSMATQIAKHYGLTVITTASKDETKEWSKSLGADIVLNHKNDLRDEFKSHNIENVDYVFCTFDTDLYYEVMIDLVKPRGHIATIVAFTENQDLNLLKAKSITFTHEFMFTRALQDLDDQYQYHRYLSEISHLISEGIYKPTVTEIMKGLSVDNIFKAHEKLENHEVHGKLVIEIEE